MKKMLFNYSVFFMAGVVKPPAWSECVRLHSFARLHVCLGICCHLHSGHDKVARTLLTHHRKCLIMQLLLRSCASCRYRSRTKITSTPIDKLVHLGKAVVAVYKERGMKKGTLVFNDTQMYGKKKTRVCFFTLFFFFVFLGVYLEVVRVASPLLPPFPLRQPTKRPIRCPPDITLCFWTIMLTCTVLY